MLSKKKCFRKQIPIKVNNYINIYCLQPLFLYLLYYALGHMISRISYTQVHELLQSHCDDKRLGTLLPRLHIYYTYFVFVFSETWALCIVSFITYDYLYTHTHTHRYIYIYVCVCVLCVFVCLFNILFKCCKHMQKQKKNINARLFSIFLIIHVSEQKFMFYLFLFLSFYVYNIHINIIYIYIYMYIYT